MVSAALKKLEGRALAAPASAERAIEIPLSKIKFDPTQPRKAFHHIDGQVAPNYEAYIDELAESIKNNGLIQAITVRKDPSDGNYVVVVGECRTRAHLKLGKATIRAVERSDLADPAQRLLFQLAENVNREDLSDHELAASIRSLLKGTDTVAPMKQVQIATAMSKSEGWVSRFVKFGDAELQRVWWQSGIADTVEKFYRLAGLPMALQADIRRRVDLPVDHPDYLEKPLNRDLIDRLMRDAKISVKANKESEQRPTSDSPTIPDVPGETGTVRESPNEPDSKFPAGGGVAMNDVIGQAFSAAASESRQQHAPEPKHGPVSSGGYQLPAEVRNSILSTAGAISVGQGEDGRGRDVVRPPVNCRVSVGNIVALADVMKSDPEILKGLEAAWADLALPASLAQLIANQLIGVIVPDTEVSATVQKELTKLR